MTHHFFQENAKRGKEGESSHKSVHHMSASIQLEEKVGEVLG